MTPLPAAPKSAREWMTPIESRADGSRSRESTPLNPRDAKQCPSTDQNRQWRREWQPRRRSVSDAVHLPSVRNVPIDGRRLARRAAYGKRRSTEMKPFESRSTGDFRKSCVDVKLAINWLKLWIARAYRIEPVPRSIHRCSPGRAGNFNSVRPASRKT